MGGTRTPGVTEADPFGWVTPPSSPGTLGRHDRADPGARSAPGDTPGSAGINDAAAALVAHAPVAATRAGRDLTPLQFEALYHNLHVSYLDRASGLAQHVAVDVHIYSNNGIARRRSNMREKERLVGLVRAELRRAGGLALIDVADGDRERIAHAFYAKGSPEDCATTFRHVLRYGVSSPGAIQDYCDCTAKIGLDCSGFVNSYFMATGRISRPRSIAAYATGPRRSSIAEIQALDVLVWQGADADQAEHIAVVDHVITGTNRFVVVESSGSKEGLVHGEYAVLQARDGIFRVDRGRDARGRRSTSDVRIASVQ